MESKKWLWILVACLVIVTVYHVVKIARVDPAEPQAPQEEPALQQDRHTTQTASLGGLPSMPEEKTPPTIEPVKIEEQKQPSGPVEPEEEDSAPMPKANQQDAEETIEKQEAPAADQQVGWALAHRNDEDGGAGPTLNAVVDVTSSNKGLVRGIVYSADSGSALIDDKIVNTGDTIDGVKVVRVHASGVDFEKDGQRWTQKVSETPDSLWQ